LFNLININWDIFWLPLVAAGVLSYILTWVIRYLSHYYNWYPKPTAHQTHTRPTSRLGGVAIFISFVLAFLLVVDLTLPRLGMLLAISIVFVMGLLDDIYNVRAIYKLLIQLLAIAIAIIFGVKIGQIANPFGGVIVFSQFWDIFFTTAWLLVVTNAMNLLDGLDGLSAGVTGIFSITLFWLSLFVVVNQPETAVIAIILLGVILGFLRWNWYPAKIFMGDSGSNMLGLLIGILAIISGAKLATAALVLAFPILDAVWAFIRRVRQGKHPFIADRQHLHHRLMSVGVSHINVVLIILSMVAILGFISLLSGTHTKLLLMGLTAIVMIMLIRSIILIQRRKGS